MSFFFPGKHCFNTLGYLSILLFVALIDCIFILIKLASPKHTYCTVQPFKMNYLLLT